MKLKEFRELNKPNPEINKHIQELIKSIEQFMKRKLLFVCAGGLDRSPAAVEIINKSKEFNKRFQAKYCGIHPLISAALTKQDLIWADEILVMEPDHKRFILENFPRIILEKPEITVLDIPNKYLRNDPELKKILKIKLKNYLPTSHKNIFHSLHSHLFKPLPHHHQ